MHSERLASMGQLAAGIAHEVNNPLGVVLLYAHLLAEQFEADSPVGQDLKLIAEQADRCKGIVAGLLDFARQSTPARKPCDINNIVNESVILTNKQAAFKDLTLVYEPGADIPPVQLDKGQIQQSIINLIINAVEATDAGGSISISTAYKPNRERVEITVSDTGEGMSEDTISKIFDPFYTTKDNGNGLGLAITHGIIEQHNGTIDVASQSGRGTTFTIKLPITPGEDHAA